MHDLIPFGTEEFDISHTIHKLSFGEDYPGRENPLNGVIVPKVNAHNREGKTGAYQYFLKVQAPSSILPSCMFLKQHCMIFRSLRDLWRFIPKLE